MGEIQALQQLVLAYRHRCQEQETRIAQLEGVLRDTRPYLVYGEHLRMSLGGKPAQDILDRADAALAAEPSPLLAVVRAAVAWDLLDRGYDETALMDAVAALLKKQPGVWEAPLDEQYVLGEDVTREVGRE